MTSLLFSLVFSAFFIFSIADECLVVPSPIHGYTKTADYINIAGQHSNQWKLVATEGVLTGKYPDYISLNGSQSTRIDASVLIDVDSRTNTGLIVAKYRGYAHISKDLESFGDWLLVSKEFGGYPERDVQVPFMQGGISEFVRVHGCSKQGESFFQETNCYLCTWGNGAVYLNGSLVYDDIYFHTMYTDRTRDQNTFAMYANADRNRIYSPDRCSEGWVDTTHRELHVIAGKYCSDKSAYPPVEMVFEMVFGRIEEQMDQIPDLPITRLFPTLVQPNIDVVRSNFNPHKQAQVYAPHLTTPFDPATPEFKPFSDAMRQWREEKDLVVEVRNLVVNRENVDDAFAFIEGVAQSRDGHFVLPIAAISSLDRHENLVSTRLYYSMTVLDSFKQAYVRSPFPRQGAKAPGPLPSIVVEYRQAIENKDLEGVLACFNPTACFRDASSTFWCGKDQLRAFYTNLLSLQGSSFNWATSTVGNSYVNSRRTVAVEFDFIWPPYATQSGIAIYEEGEDGLLSNIRTYDEIVAAPTSSVVLN